MTLNLLNIVLHKLLCLSLIPAILMMIDRRTDEQTNGRMQTQTNILERRNKLYKVKHSVYTRTIIEITKVPTTHTMQPEKHIVYVGYTTCYPTLCSRVAYCVSWVHNMLVEGAYCVGSTLRLYMFYTSQTVNTVDAGQTA